MQSVPSLTRQHRRIQDFRGVVTQ